VVLDAAGWVDAGADAGADAAAAAAFDAMLRRIWAQ